MKYKRVPNDAYRQVFSRQDDGEILQTILVVEDNELLRESLVTLLQSDGYSVVTAVDGLDGIETLRRIRNPSVILLNYKMPHMSGSDFLKIKNSVKGFAEIPVIGISGADDGEEALDGVNDYLKHPFNVATLLKTVRKHCQTIS
jgi:CheY-like chemotaxis protein